MNTDKLAISVSEFGTTLGLYERQIGGSNEQTVALFGFLTELTSRIPVLSSAASGPILDPPVRKAVSDIRTGSQVALEAILRSEELRSSEVMPAFNRLYSAIHDFSVA